MWRDITRGPRPRHDDRGRDRCHCRTRRAGARPRGPARRSGRRPRSADRARRDRLEGRLPHTGRRIPVSLRGAAGRRYRWGQSAVRPSRERASPGKADMAPKAGRALDRQWPAAVARAADGSGRREPGPVRGVRPGPARSQFRPGPGAGRLAGRAGGCYKVRGGLLTTEGERSSPGQGRPRRAAGAAPRRAVRCPGRRPGRRRGPEPGRRRPRPPGPPGGLPRPRRAWSSGGPSSSSGSTGTPRPR